MSACETTFPAIRRRPETARHRDASSQTIHAKIRELRESLHTICGFAELLLERNSGSADPDQLRFASRIEHAAAALPALVNDLVKLTRERDAF